MPACSDAPENSDHKPDGYRGRFAPSPSGPLHFGSLFTALASYLQAKSRNGIWLLRIDDVDPERSRPTAADGIQRTLERFGLHWDQRIAYQSQHTDRYRQALLQLDEMGLIYPCDCSRRELAGHPIYPGYCRKKRSVDRSRTHALRVDTRDAVIRFADRLHGRLQHNVEKETGDFIVLRRDRAVAYHLATVIDDADARVSEILRGIDLLDSTPRQIHLQRSLRCLTPAYCHVPVLVDQHGAKLSKQSFAKPVDEEPPGPTLYRLLQLLRQEPPTELSSAEPPELLAWAIMHWDVGRLAGIRSIPVSAADAGLSAAIAQDQSRMTQ